MIWPLRGSCQLREGSRCHPPTSADWSKVPLLWHARPPLQRAPAPLQWRCYSRSPNLLDPAKLSSCFSPMQTHPTAIVSQRQAVQRWPEPAPTKLPDCIFRNATVRFPCEEVLPRQDHELLPVQLSTHLLLHPRELVRSPSVNALHADPIRQSCNRQVLLQVRAGCNTKDYILRCHTAHLEKLARRAIHHHSLLHPGPMIPLTTAWYSSQHHPMCGW
mmetsp:Transcript_34976/g.55676  ORF Transcript_34976/g.55676 Transcript_34976/m.55676 type:complete len:217 (+) Transcript_34976:2332-2982(+)